VPIAVHWDPDSGRSLGADEAVAMERIKRIAPGAVPDELWTDIAGGRVKNVWLQYHAGIVLVARLIDIPPLPSFVVPRS